MPYSRKYWTDGETVYATNMNHIEEGIEEASESGGKETVYVATLSHDGGASSYTMDAPLEDIIDTINTGALVKIVVVESGTAHIYDTFIITSYYTLGNIDNIIVCPIINDINTYVPCFSIYLDYQSGTPTGVINIRDDFSPYIMINGYRKNNLYSVPMVSSDNEISFHSINEYFDFENTAEQLISGALLYASSSGEATIASYITDSETIANSHQVLSLIGRNITSCRGSIIKLNNGNGEYLLQLLNVEAVYDSNNGELARGSFNARICINDYTASGGTLSSFTEYDGTITLSVDYDTQSQDQGEPIGAVMAIHLEKHEAIIM